MLDGAAHDETLLSIEELEVRGFRNLATQRVRLHARFNVLSGDNGQGKTNALEAIYLAATSHSFRTTALGECVQHGSDSALACVRVGDPRDLGAPPREQRVEIVEGRRRVRLDGKRPPTLAAYALATPVVLFDPSSLTLTQGGARERRKLLDRVALHIAARAGGGEALLRDQDRYREALLRRRRALERGISAAILAPYEHILSEHGARIVAARASAAAALRAPCIEAFRSIALTREPLAIDYAPRAPADPEAFARALEERRETDARRGTATVGPHLDDLSLALGDRPVRQVASQGQHRALVLALKSAELSTIATARDVRPVLLLDDVSSELDRTRNAAFFDFLRAQVGQVVLTTTRPDLVPLASDRLDLRVCGGLVE